MRIFRALLALASLSTLTGCGYIHFGRVEPVATATGDAGVSTAYTNLSTEHKILKQELALARKEGDALRAAIDRGPGAASPELVNQLNETTREMATLRANYAKLQAERASPGSPGDAASVARTSDLEERLAASLRNYTQLQEENAKLRVDIDRARAENSTLAGQLKTATSQNEQAQTALAQLNTELLAQKDARARAEQATAAVRTQLGLVMTSREATPPAAGNGTSSASAALALAKAPPADSSVSAELRTNPDRLRAGAPAEAPPPAKAARTHVVATGDTLEKLAEKYYGDPKRWVRIYTANIDMLRDGRPIKAGMELEIPEK